MTLDQARQAWKNGQPSDSDLAARVAAMRTRTSTFESNLLRRDWTETAAVVFVVIAFLPGALSLPTVMARAGAWLIIVHALVIAAVLWISRNNQPDLSTDRPPVDYLAARRRSVERQIRLLATVPWWYVAPSFVGQLLVAFGLRRTLLEATPFVAICTIVCGVIVWLNLRAAWYHLPQLRDAIQATINDLQQDTP